MRQFLEEYAKHAVLNFGQAMQGIRYFLSHPDINRHAPLRGMTQVSMARWYRHG